MKIEEVVIKFEETVIKTSQRMTAIEAHFPDLKFSVMKIEVFSEGLYSLTLYNHLYRLLEFCCTNYLDRKRHSLIYEHIFI